MATGKPKYLLVPPLIGVIFMFAGCSVGGDPLKKEKWDEEANTNVMTNKIHLSNASFKDGTRDIDIIDNVPSSRKFT